MNVNAYTYRAFFHNGRRAFMGEETTQIQRAEMDARRIISENDLPEMHIQRALGYGTKWETVNTLKAYTR